MLPDRVSNPGPLTYESGALPIALRGPARTRDSQQMDRILLRRVVVTMQFWTAVNPQKENLKPLSHRLLHSVTRAVTRQHSSPELVLAHHEHKVLNSKLIRKVMLLPYNTLKLSEYNLPFRHINKSMNST